MVFVCQVVRLHWLSSRRLIEAIALKFFENAEGGGESSAVGGAVAQEQVGGELGVFGAEEGEQLAAGRGDQTEFVVYIDSLAVHFNFVERCFHVRDAAVAPGSGDHFVDEFSLDAVDGLEAMVEVDEVLVILARVLVREEDDVAGAEVVAHGVPGGGCFAFG